VEATQVPVAIGGVRVDPGDYMIGDGDGVVAVPATRIEEVLESAEQIHQAEERIREQVERGMNLRDARREVGYHNLQTRRDKSHP
jgi:regulator of RNase E activity RraA